MEFKVEFDVCDWQLFEVLQVDVCLGYVEFGCLVCLFVLVVVECVKWLEEVGVICGYCVVIDFKCLGYSIDVMVCLCCDGGICVCIGVIVQDIFEVFDCCCLVGEDFVLLYLVVMLIGYLEIVFDCLLKIYLSISIIILVVLQMLYVNCLIMCVMWNVVSVLLIEQF